MIKFSYQYPPEAKTHLKDSRKSAMEFFHEFFVNSQKTTVAQSLFNKVVDFCNFTERKDPQYRCFLMHFARYLRHLFYGKASGDYFCSKQKYFTNNIVKNSLRKEEMETACKKSKDTHKKNLITIYIKFSYPFIIKKFLYFSFLSFLWYIENAT